MRALTVSALVRADHTLTVQVPADVPAGVYQAVVVLHEGPDVSPRRLSLSDWPPPHDVGPKDPAATYRREDLYGDDGR